ncbi:MAG: diaminopimelate dehydrogenase [Dethiobacteria bacterium]|jgi:diaminopimelate dehydrogenase|nr:diaminopimelate dehydrogenase [Bacillota bacterium]NMD33503.1 diaminopimelate dehydrogenase [Bacillota bacterium]HOB29611.1 diaminopimelate dehydrogenase [Bacillota bacterium]HPZ42239.1 diaminopimelate dehydrogenase [Bacillota bacterium]HQD52213.1 diaminopimelate dehydrogenase [Bacillota bacterium]
MKKIRVCVVGFGNVGREAVECIRRAPGMKLAGVVRRAVGENHLDRPMVTRVEELGPVDVALLAVPSRLIPEVAPLYLQKGINTVDGYDLHGEPMLYLRDRLNRYAKKNERVAITGAGWDPGTDSVIRMLFEAVAPGGITYTDFGPGMSMGHSVAARSIPGVKDAVAMTLPLGYGRHRRDVYVELNKEADFAEIAEQIREDPYFDPDRTEVIQVDDLTPIKVTGHGVRIARAGSSGTAQNQLLELNMRITNPAATAQIMAAAARACMRLKPGCYVLGEVPPIDLLPVDREAAIQKLV